MNTQTHSEVLAMLETWLVAIRAEDIDAIGRHYAADVTAYDAAGGLRFQGRAAYTEHWRRCLACCEGGRLIYEPQPPAVFADSQLAVVHFLLRCGKRKTDGSEDSSWMRTTLGLRREAGGWLIFHEHNSIPFDLESGQTQFGLSP